MIYKTFFIVILLLLSLSQAADKKKYPEDLLTQAGQKLLQQRYESADSLCQKILEKNPLNHAALYLRLSIYQTRILDYESYSCEGRAFLGRADSVCMALARILPTLRGGDSVACLLELGNAYGGSSVILAKNDNWLSAVKKALRARSCLKAVLRADSSADAARLGLGLFDYYVAARLAWVPFVKKQQSSALLELTRALQAPFPVNYAAKNSLCWIYIDKGDYSLSRALAETALLAMPRNTIFLRIKCKLALLTSQWRQGIALGNKLLEISFNRTPVNWSDCLAGYRTLINSYDALGEKKICIDLANKALSLSVPTPYREIPTIIDHTNYIKSIKQKYENY